MSRRFFYSRLALSNLRKNSRIYAPYIFACSVSVMMLYIMLFLLFSPGLHEMDSTSLITVMGLGCIVIGFFSTGLLWYTNSFLIKRRKKEIGLFNILGMEKRHIARLMATETVFTALLSIISGLLLGILFSKLALLALLRLAGLQTQFGFSVPLPAVLITLLFFFVEFLFILLTNIGRVHLARPIELLYGGSVGEREPRASWLLTLLGVLTLGAGYAMALSVRSPLRALELFFIAVMLVIIGTYCLFTSGSIAMLKAMRRNKKYYYRTDHFTAVSGMIYRMKQNAAGLASICILSTMVLVMLSTTVCLYFGIDDALRAQFPRNIGVTGINMTAEQAHELERRLNEAVEESGIETEGVVSYRYAYFSYSGTQSDSTIYLIPPEEYERMGGEPVTLAENEVLVYSPDEDFRESTVTLRGTELRVAGVLDSLNVAESESTSTRVSLNGMPLRYLIMREDTIMRIYPETNDLDYYYGVDVPTSREAQRELHVMLSLTAGEYSQELPSGVFARTRCAEDARGYFIQMYGGLFFLGIFLSLLFISATAMIMYYKQISEGYDDKVRFEIMQKVGMSRAEVRKTIRSQVLIVFFLPLLAAAVHVAAAFNMISRLMAVLDLVNLPLFIICTLATLALFGVLYAAVYALTARAYYRIVE
ncbi:MAG: FtsX-like permease family protein [Clostridia bacterium]|nr:FtsX-like permease family protein [Clostridia bacterium]